MKENGEIRTSEVGRHSTAAASVAVALMNPKKGHRFHYRATKYSLEVLPAEGTIHRELSAVLNSDEISFPTDGSSPDECTIYCR